MDEKHIDNAVLRATGSRQVINREPIQSLWSGYGTIRRFVLLGGNATSVIVKHVDPCGPVGQPRGWNTERSHARKLRSYEVEHVWYRDVASRLPTDCRIAKCYHAEHGSNGFLFVLEDLDAAGFNLRFRALPIESLDGCLRWLARFHACLLGHSGDGLWATGTYWHLATRPDEWAAMPDRHPLKTHAERIDQALSKCRFRTVVHGDAKVANFCFASSESDVAAVDFQYAGGGCGMKDVAYFLGSCLTDEDCDRHAEYALDIYFDALASRLASSIDADAVETEWRRLYPVAWADFNRFLIGWSPGHHKLHTYSRRMAERALEIVSS